VARTRLHCSVGRVALLLAETHAGWWIVSTLVLLVSPRSLYMRRAARIRQAVEFIVLCGVLHAVFAFYAYSVPRNMSSMIPVLVAGRSQGSRATAGFLAQPA